MIGAVRERVRRALREDEVLAPAVEGRGFLQGWPTPAVVRRRRSEVAAHLQAGVLALWERAGSAVSQAGPSALMDGDGGSVAWSLPPAHALDVARDAVVLLEGLADAAENDQRHLDGVSQTAHGRSPDAARLIACKRRYRLLATRALLPLTESGDDAAFMKMLFEELHYT